MRKDTLDYRPVVTFVAFAVGFAAVLLVGRLTAPFKILLFVLVLLILSRMR